MSVAHRDRRPYLDQARRSTAPGWLWVGSLDESAELAELRARLAAAEERAEEAEAALPHLLALGQRTANALLSDARARGREIVAQARRRGAAELETSRRQVREEARALEQLRMAVAAEAMGLEAVRDELRRRVSISAAELARVAAHPLIFGGATVWSDPWSSGALAPELQAVIGPPPLPAPPPPTAAELGEAGVAISAQRPEVGFARAWAEDDDERTREAFERFFSQDLDADPGQSRTPGPDPLEAPAGDGLVATERDPAEVLGQPPIR